ncbi:hypothetical protein F5B18DRAFT_643089 [Nemania serpens]|nr:hypothetical protein F5B18DRAFT_643089 [Nemania serpens]
MPEIIERDGGVRVVYVRPFFHAAEIKRERKEKERQKDTKGSDAGPNAAVATPPAENSATDLVQLTESMLNEALPRLSSADRALGKGPSADENVDDESWTRISNGSYGDMETA